jgi:hypothetical protein
LSHYSVNVLCLFIRRRAIVQSQFGETFDAVGGGNMQKFSDDLLRRVGFVLRGGGRNAQDPIFILF